MTVGKSNSLAVPAARAARPARGVWAARGERAREGIGERVREESSTGSRATAWIVSAGVFVVNLDLFIVNVAVPALSTSFDGSLARLAFLGPQRLRDRLRRPARARRPARRPVRAPARLPPRPGGLHRRLRAVCRRPRVGWLVAARALQAAGAAALMPTSLALLLVNTAPERRPQAIRGWAAIGGIAAGLGPVMAGCSWRPTGAGCSSSTCLSGGRPGGRGPAAARRPPGPRRTAAGPGRAPRCSRSPSAHSRSAWSRPERGAGVRRPRDRLAGRRGVLAAAFWLRSARHTSPSSNCRSCASRPSRWRPSPRCLFTVAFAAMLLTSVLWCQQVWSYSAIRTGLAIAPGPLVVPVLAVASGPVVRRLGAGRVAAAASSSPAA